MTTTTQKVWTEDGTMGPGGIVGGDGAGPALCRRFWAETSEGVETLTIHSYTVERDDGETGKVRYDVEHMEVWDLHLNATVSDLPELPSEGSISDITYSFPYDDDCDNEDDAERAAKVSLGRIQVEWLA